MTDRKLMIDCPRCGHCCPQRQWVGLTDEEIDQAAEQSDNYASFVAGARFAQDKLKEKNT